MNNNRNSEVNLASFSAGAELSPAKVLINGREVTLTKHQEAAAQHIANGGTVSMPKRSGKTIVRARVTDILRQRNEERQKVSQTGAKLPNPASAPGVTGVVPPAAPLADWSAPPTKAKSIEAYTLLDVDNVEVLGVFSNKTNAVHFATAREGGDINSLVAFVKDTASCWVTGDGKYRLERKTVRRSSGVKKNFYGAQPVNAVEAD